MEEGVIIKNDLEKAPRTGDWGYVEPKIEVNKCTGCASCVRFCPDACLEMRKRTIAQKNDSQENFQEKDLATVDLDFCKGCGVCAEICPFKAIVMTKK